MSTENIYQKMTAITMDIEAVAKNLSVGYGQASYKAVGEADVLAAVKPIEARYGVYSYPLSRRIVESGELESTKKDGSILKQLYMRVETVYRFVNTDKPEEFIDITTYGDGVDTQDKAPGKAMTYGDKYALLKAYKIITGDDPDQKASEPLRGTRTKEELDRAVTANEVEFIRRTAKDYGVSEEKILKACKVKSLNEFTYSRYVKLVENMKDLKDK